jgi:leucyl aminopeptidase (aminopeptidase T)
MYTKGEWTEVPVTVTGEDAEYIHYKAEVASNSSFAITGQQVADSHGKANNPTGQVSTSSKDETDENMRIYWKLLLNVFSSC